MADSTLFTLRPIEGKSETLDGAFRIHFHPDDLKALNLSLGDPCLLKNQAGKEGIGVAWRSPTAKNRRLINVSHVLREAFEFNVGDKLSVSQPSAGLPHAKEVLIRQLSSLDLALDPADVEFRARWALYNLEGIWTGGHFDVSLKYPQPAKVRFVIERIDGHQGPQSVPTPWQFQHGTILRVSGNAHVEERDSDDGRQQSVSIDFTGVGGLNKQLERLHNEIEYMKMLVDSESSSARYLQDDHPSRILLHGASGTGKTLVLSKIRSGPFRHVVELNIRSKQGVKAETTISQAFSNAVARQPSALIIDDIDEIAGKDSLNAHTIKAEIDSLGSTQLMIIAAARNSNNIHDRLRPKFDCEIELPVPDIDARFDILRAFRPREAKTPTDELLREVASMTHGYTGHDLRQLARQAQLDAALRNVKAKSPVTDDVHSAVWSAQATEDDELSDWKNNSKALTDTLKPETGTEHYIAGGDKTNVGHTTHSVTITDFRSASKLIRPTAMRELFFETPRISWSDIGGSESVKRALWRVVDLPFKHPDIMARSPYTPPRGILLYGPPGCSKTLTAKAIASSSGLNFISIKGAELTSMYVGETERALRDVFRKAQTAAPSVIFFDEIDAIAAAREGGGGGTPGLNVVTTLLTEMDGMQTLRDVLVLAATNRPDVLDPALLRPGRFDTVLYVPPPPLEARRQILGIHTKHDAFGSLDLDDLALKTEGFSGAEIVEVCNRAVGAWTEREAETAMQRVNGAAARADGSLIGHSKVSPADFEQALSQVHKVITPEMIKRYEDWAAQRGDIARLQ